MASLGTVNIPKPDKSACCPCSQQGSGCSCGGPPSTMNCQSLTSGDGTASYCGFAEFVPSTPPNYYLQMNLSGGTSTTCAGPSCSPTTCSQSIAYSGVNSIDPVTCILNQLGQVVIAGSCSADTGTFTRGDVKVGDAQGFVTGVSFNFSDNYPNAYTHQLLNGGTPGACILSGSGFTGCIQPSAPGGQSVLSNQETAAQAIARAIIGRAYGGTDCSLNTSYASFPNAGSRIFTFRKAQVQAVFLGTPGNSYQVTITLTERTFGSGGPFTPYGLIQFSVVAPPSGNVVTPWQDIPIVQGFEIKASSCVVTPM